MNIHAALSALLDLKTMCVGGGVTPVNCFASV